MVQSLREVDNCKPPWSRTAEIVFGPILVVAGARDLAHQVGGGDVLQLTRRDAVAQRLQRVVNGLDRRREGRVGLQRDADAVRRQPFAIPKLTTAAAENERDLNCRRYRFDCLDRDAPGEEYCVDAGGFIGLRSFDRLVEPGD